MSINFQQKNINGTLRIISNTIQVQFHYNNNNNNTTVERQKFHDSILTSWLFNDFFPLNSWTDVHLPAHYRFDFSQHLVRSWQDKCFQSNATQSACICFWQSGSCSQPTQAAGQQERCSYNSTGKFIKTHRIHTEYTQRYCSFAPCELSQFALFAVFSQSLDKAKKKTAERQSLGRELGDNEQKERQMTVVIFFLRHKSRFYCQKMSSRLI